MKTTRIYTCEDSLEGILSAVHAAYMSRYGHGYQSLEVGTSMNLSLFSDVIPVVTDMEKAMRVADAVIHKISAFAWHWVKYGAMSCHMDKGDIIYKFLVKGFRTGPEITEYLADPGGKPAHEAEPGGIQRNRSYVWLFAFPGTEKRRSFCHYCAEASSDTSDRRTFFRTVFRWKTG